MPKPIRRDTRQTSCDECHRRKQRCISSRDGGPCDHCARRFPPVQCIGRPLSGARQEKRNPDGGAENNVKLILGITKEQSCRNLLPKAGSLPYGNPRSFGGILTAVNCADIPSVDPSSRNTELFHFYQDCQALAPTMASLDGQDTPSVIHTKILPWMMQSPLMPQIAIFTASGYRALIRGQDVTRCPETIAIKGMLLSSINSYLKYDFDKIYEEAIQSVVHLALLEWVVGDPTNMWAHMKGLKGMLTLRGGIKELQNLKLRQLLVLSDYMLSCSFERNLYLVQPQDSFIIPSSLSYPESYSTPLFASDTKFKDIHKSLGLSPAIASILDDVSFLTTIILSVPTSKNSPAEFSPNKGSKFVQSTALWIYENYHLLPINTSDNSSTIDIIYETIHISAMVYTSAIASRVPFSLAYTSGLRLKLYENLQRVDLSSWKKMPGIFLWILFVACPGSGNDVQGRLLRRTASLTSIYLGFRALALSHWCLRRLLGVQRWIVDGGYETDSEEDFY